MGRFPTRGGANFAQRCYNGENRSKVTSTAQRGLPSWIYDDPFANISVRLDDVNDTLEKRFVVEANTALDNIIEDIRSRSESVDGDCGEGDSVTPLRCLKTFISDCLLEKLRYGANRVLHRMKKTLTTKEELLGLVVLHVLCAAYDESPSTVCDMSQGDFFFQMGLTAERYHLVWGALCGTTERRSTYDMSATGWSRTANRSTTLIAEVESETAAINRDLLFVPKATVLSLDDDHLRMSSRAVTELTYLRQLNNPKKGLGPVGNALCSALNPFFLACHFTRCGEKVLHTWERLAQLLQGVSTTGALRPLPDAIFPADRGYNSKESIEFVSGVLGASILGTHRRDMWYPYVFGDGPISRRHKGMVISEKGCRAVHTARLRNGTSRASRARAVEACVYRESCSGRVAALIHNNSSLFPSRCFTIVFRDSYRDEAATAKLGETMVLFDEVLSVLDPRTRAMRSKNLPVLATNGRSRVEQVLGGVMALTYLQSEDPVWFLLRAFRFTSRTGYGFIAAVARDYVTSMRGMVWLLRGKTLTEGVRELNEDADEVRLRIKVKWDTVTSALGMRLADKPRPSSRRAAADRLTDMSPSRISSSTKSDLQSILSVFERSLDTRVSKSELVSAVNQLKADIACNSVGLDADSSAGENEEEGGEQAAKTVSNAFREASLDAWVMKPLVATAGMKEGTRNEQNIVEALPKFFKDSAGAYRCPIGSSTFSWDASFSCRIMHIRCTGLIESRRCAMLADSPDAVLAMQDEEEELEVCAVEVKTMTSVTTVEAAKDISEMYGPVVALENVGMSDKSTALFRELVPTVPYRSQVLHHAATRGINSVMYVVGTGGSITDGRILYVCYIKFAGLLRHSYTFSMDCIRVASFSWVGGESENVPKEYDDILKNSHASDLYSFASYYGLSEAIRKELRLRGEPIPPARMIRLTPAVYWNNLKGGVDVISRYFRTLARTNISENPVVSIIARLLSMQVNNAAVAFRLHKARTQLILPSVEEFESSRKIGYASVRHRVTQCESFGAFARKLAKEWFEECKSGNAEEMDVEMDRDGKTCKPLFARNAGERYNLGTHMARRLNRRIQHKKISGPSTYCVLCPWSLGGTKDGKVKIKRKGSRQVQWCKVCEQAVCTVCWSDWHSKDTLKRSKPTNAEKRSFEQSLRSVRRRTVYFFVQFVNFVRHLAQCTVFIYCGQRIGRIGCVLYMYYYIRILQE